VEIASENLHGRECGCRRAVPGEGIPGLRDLISIKRFACDGCPPDHDEASKEED
jgi:hypothetical protein